MLRIRLIPDRRRPLPAYRYLDSLHAALIHGLAVEGKAGSELMGEGAPLWTFATEGFSDPGGRKRLREIVISTLDAALADVLRRLRPEMVRSHSSNGDRIDLTGASISMEADPIAPGQGVLFVRPLSPVVISHRVPERRSRRWIETTDEVDLSAAVSAGLSRRLKRRVTLEARIDRLAAAARERNSAFVRVRAAKGRDILIPGFDLPLALAGSEEDLRAAWYAGLGEKCRYGFGCLALPHTSLV